MGEEPPSDPALAACDMASAMLRRLGFRHAYTSMKSEACYYVLPGYAGAIRIAAHRFGRTESRARMMPVASALTFGKNQGDRTPHHIEQRVRVALGHYLFARLSDQNGPVAQLDERLISNREDAGSSPAGSTNLRSVVNAD